jgi:nucleoside-diphosphate-sugar epimerase
LIEDLTGKKARLEYQKGHPADVPATWADISKAKKILGWSPQVSFREGMKRLVEWYEENRSWANEIDTN